MSGSDIFYTLLSAIAGLGVFIFGMKLMGDSLESVSGNRIKGMFSKLDNNPFLGIGIGLGTTAVIQSSSAVTVMLVGFVNAGLMTLTQATSVIYGTNIGTTVTAQLVAWGYGGIASFDLTAIFAACAGVGAFMILFTKKHDIVKKIGAIICGLGMIFVGLTVMGDGMGKFGESPAVVEAFSKVDNPMLLLLLGTVFTAIIQSSSAMSGLVITMSAAGIMSFPQAMYIIVGSNIGTCITALLCAIGTGTNAKRTAIVHLLFNVFGVIIFMLTDLFAHYDRLLMRWFTTPQVQIAMLHTLFNVATVIILLPFTKLLVKLTILIVPERASKASDAFRLKYLSDQILSTPPIAVANLKLEILNMFSIAKSNLDTALNAAVNADESGITAIERNEKELNYLNREITKFLVKLSGTDISAQDANMVATAYHTVSDIERIGDYAENIAEYGAKLKADNMKFSDESVKEITELGDTLGKMYELTRKIYEEDDPGLIPELYEYEQSTDNQKVMMGEKHIERLSQGTCNAETGALYLSLASDCERVADHFTNIANATKSYAAVKPQPQEQKK